MQRERCICRNSEFSIINEAHCDRFLFLSAFSIDHWFSNLNEQQNLLEASLKPRLLGLSFSRCKVWPKNLHFYQVSSDAGGAALETKL